MRSALFWDIARRDIPEERRSQVKVLSGRIRKETAGVCVKVLVVAFFVCIARTEPF
jgi:hypothetical protein